MQFVFLGLMILLGGQTSVEEAPLRSGARELYENAAAAIATNDLDSACSLLSELIRLHSDSPLAEVAAFHLSECYLLQSQSLLALRVLREWAAHIAQSPTIEQLEPGIKAQAKLLLPRILQSFPDDAASTEALANQIALGEAERGSGMTEVDQAIAMELVGRYQSNQDFAQAHSCLQQVIDASQGTDTAVPERRLHFELPLVWAEHALSHKQPRQAVDIITSALSAKQTSEQELALRFLLAEAHFAAGESAEAAEQYRWLTECAARYERPPDWLAGVVLRRAELLVSERDIGLAQQLLLTAKRELTDFERAYEFDYLLARCAIAGVDFDRAVELLQRVVVAARGEEASARAGWMLGEVYFLQRNYAQALAAYARVTEFTSYPQWQAQAWLQAAKCHELLGDAPAALAAYTQATKLNQRPELTQEAAARMAVLQSAPPNLR